jgi:hypothetical protein
MCSRQPLPDLAFFERLSVDAGSRADAAKQKWERQQEYKRELDRQVMTRCPEKENVGATTYGVGLRSKRVVAMPIENTMAEELSQAQLTAPPKPQQIAVHASTGLSVPRRPASPLLGGSSDDREGKLTKQRTYALELEEQIRTRERLHADGETRVRPHSAPRTRRAVETSTDKPSERCADTQPRRLLC